jgi:hypothetical protein
MARLITVWVEGLGHQLVLQAKNEMFMSFLKQSGWEFKKFAPNAQKVPENEMKAPNLPRQKVLSLLMHLCSRQKEAGTVFTQKERFT